MRAVSITRAATVAALAALGLGGFWGEPAFGDRPEPVASKPAPEAAAAPDPAQVQVASVPEDVAIPAPKGRLGLPDGSWVPALNGAEGEHDLAKAWERGRPFAPILDVVDGPYCQFYRHADGTLSTTQMVWREDLGRDDVCVWVAHPQAHVAPWGPRESLDLERR